MDPGGSECLLKLREAHDIDVDELNHLVALGGATGLVPHHPAHDPENINQYKNWSHLTECSVQTEKIHNSFASKEEHSCKQGQKIVKNENASTGKANM